MSEVNQNKQEKNVHNELGVCRDQRDLEIREHTDPPTCNDDNGITDQYPVSKFREALPQFLAVGAKNLVLITYGTSVGFPTILIPELQKKNSEIPVTLDEVTWIGSINFFLIPLSSFISGPISQRLGRRRTMMISMLPFLVAWTMFHNAAKANMVIAAQALTGLAGGLLQAPILTYVAEVTQPHLRGLLSATSIMSVISGVFTQMLSGSFVGWRTLVLINMIYPILSLTALCCVPESPTWLAGENKLPEAERALRWLRGWVTPEHVKNEFQELRESSQKSVKVINIDSAILGSDNPEEQRIPKKNWESYCQKTFYLPFAVVALTFAIFAFGGTIVIQIFSVVILDEFKTPINKYKAAVIVGAAQLLGTMICVCIIHFTGKRKLVFVSVFMTGFLLLLISIYAYLIMFKNIDSEKHAWIPTTLLIAASFFSHLCLKSLPWILAGEVFPADVRSIAAGSAGSIGYIFISIANKLYLYMERDMSLPGTFLFYSIMNFFGLIGLYFILPETEGRTLKEIEEYFASVQLKALQFKHRKTIEDSSCAARRSDNQHDR